MFNKSNLKTPEQVINGIFNKKGLALEDRMAIGSIDTIKEIKSYKKADAEGKKEIEMAYTVNSCFNSVTDKPKLPNGYNLYYPRNEAEENDLIREMANRLRRGFTNYDDMAGMVERMAQVKAEEKLDSREIDTLFVTSKRMIVAAKLLQNEQENKECRVEGLAKAVNALKPAEQPIEQPVDPAQ